MSSDPSHLEDSARARVRTSFMQSQRTSEDGRLPSHVDILRYWETRQVECGLGVDWADGLKRCWRCAETRPLQRCHIVASALGGGDGPDNLVLLCLACHHEAPDVVDPGFMWRWIRATVTGYYGQYWYLRAIDEYKRIYGPPPDVERDVVQKDVMSAVEKHIQKTTTHAYAPNPISAATRAWLIRRVFVDLGLVACDEAATGRMEEAPPSSEAGGMG